MTDKLVKDWKNFVQESGFSRTRQTMAGLAPRISTIAFLTAENPNGKPASPAFNKNANRELEQALRNMNLGFRKVAGKFGSEEKSYMVNNISKNEAIELGQKFGQEAVIFGEKQKDKDGVYFRFDYIERGNTINSRNTSVGGDTAQRRDDFYSSVKGKKFFIPFFDEEYEDAKTAYDMEESALEEKEIDYLREYERRLALTLEQDRTAKSKWQHRGVMKSIHDILSERKLTKENYSKLPINTKWVISNLLGNK
jgi:hypothetical protein